jgi:hypothetical protein
MMTGFLVGAEIVGRRKETKGPHERSFALGAAPEDANVADERGGFLDVDPGGLVGEFVAHWKVKLDLKTSLNRQDSCQFADICVHSR